MLVLLPVEGYMCTLYQDASGIHTLTPSQAPVSLEQSRVQACSGLRGMGSTVGTRQWSMSFSLATLGINTIIYGQHKEIMGSLVADYIGMFWRLSYCKVAEDLTFCQFDHATLVKAHARPFPTLCL